MKPDIVFYGEVLPMRFIDLVHDDVDSCDLLMVLGTSLLVAPVANIPLWVSESSDSLPRVLVNRELAGDFRKGKLTDVFVKGDCDDRCVHYGVRVHSGDGSFLLSHSYYQ